MANVENVADSHWLHEVRVYVRHVLLEKKRDKRGRLLYHIGPRPAAPKPGHPGPWERFGRKVEGGVFMSPNPVGIRRYHGIMGNVYAYRVPEWVIKKSGGMTKYDGGTEILISTDVWREAGGEIKFLGQKWSAEQLEDAADLSYSKHGGMLRGTSDSPVVQKTSGQMLRSLKALMDTSDLRLVVRSMSDAAKAEMLKYVNEKITSITSKRDQNAAFQRQQNLKWLQQGLGREPTPQEYDRNVPAHMFPSRELEKLERVRKALATR